MRYFTSLKDLPGHTVIVAGGKFISRLLSSRSDISFVDPIQWKKGTPFWIPARFRFNITQQPYGSVRIKRLGFHNIKEVGQSIKNAPCDSQR
jgi:hypothetical protein